MVTKVLGLALDCRDADALADFYERMLGWKKTLSGGGWAGIHTPQGFVLAFQTVEEYAPPEWPWRDGAQQQMAHIDFQVVDLESAVAHACSCGATKAPEQFFETSTVLFDPEGHPFCLSTSAE